MFASGLEFLLSLLESRAIAAGGGGAFAIEGLPSGRFGGGVARLKAIHSGAAVVGELGIGGLGVKESQGKRFDLRPVVNTLGIEGGLQVVDDLGVRYIGQLGLGVVGQKGFENVLRLVEEVEDEGGFARKGAVEPRQGLHAVYAVQFFIDVHGAELGLIKAGLVFIGDDQNVEVSGVEGFRQVAPVEARIEPTAGFGHFFRNDIIGGDAARKGHQGMHIVIAFFDDVGFEGELVAHGLLAAARDHHGLGLAVEQVVPMGSKVLDYHLDFLADVVGVQAHPAGQLGAGFFRLYFLVCRCFVRGGMGDFPGGGVGGVVEQHIENKALFNGLAHGVEVKGFGLVVGAGGLLGMGETPK